MTFDLTAAVVPETFYFFGDNDVEEWQAFFDEYEQPPYSLPMHTAALSFGLAGAGTGVPFHFHGPGFAETLFGRKRWFLTQPDFKPEFHPNKTTLQWYLEDYQRVRNEVDIMECTLRPGEVGQCRKCAIFKALNEDFFFSDHLLP